MEPVVAPSGERGRLERDAVVRELEWMAVVDPLEFAEVRTLADLKRLPLWVRRAVVGWTVDRNGVVQLKFAREFALGLLAKYFRLTDEGDGAGVSGESLAVRLAKSRARVVGRDGDAKGKP